MWVHYSRPLDGRGSNVPLGSEVIVDKAEQAGENGLARFVVRLSDGLMPPEEISALNDLGMVEYLPFFRQALIVLPGRYLLDLASMPSVVQIV